MQELKVIDKEPSFLERTSLKDIYKEVQDVYLSDQRPWVLGYSGGKDSTTSLQLIWYAIAGLKPEQRTKPVYVISSDTLVETPIIVNYIETNLQKINDTAKKQNMPFTANKLTPATNDSFWVNLLGRGYPAPSKTFRWCTERLKIRPADKFITEKVSQFGEVVLILGIRKGESASRDQVMSLHEIKGSLLSRHGTLPGAFVYTPIKDFSVRDVWTYLLQYQSPWGNNNRDLAAMYKNAQAGECPLVVDKTTPSCGNSRFGCWVCTVVSRDKSMENLIDSGEEWMQPLLEIRDFLSSTQNPEKKRLYREMKRRTGGMSFRSDGSGQLTPGPYKLEFRKELLKRILKAQHEIRKSNSSMTLIYPEELSLIRKIWITESGDWEDSVPKIYKEVVGTDLEWIRDDSGAFSGKEKAILNELCEKQGVPLSLVVKLLDTEFQTQGMAKRSSIYEKLSRVLNEEWRTEEEVLEEWKREHS